MMLQFKCLIFFSGLLLVYEHSHAESQKKHGNIRLDESLRSYVFEPSDEFSDFQGDATTAYPPLVEYESNTPTIELSVPNPPPPPPPPKPEEEIISQKVPNDPVGQYFNSYGVPYYPQSNSYPSNYYPSYPWPYLSQPQYLTQTQQNVPTAQQPNYLQMPEYEGILVPVQTYSPPQRTQMQVQVPTIQPQPITSTSSKNSESKSTPIANKSSSDLALILQALLPQSVIQFIIAIGNFILNSFSTIAFAGAITSVLCSITPICTISFGSLPFSFRQVLIDSGDVTTIQRVRRAAEVVTSALDKYEQLQKGVESLTISLKKAQRKSYK